MSNPILYVFTYSVWSSLARLAKHDLGFTNVEVEEKQVRLDLNTVPLKMIQNPKGTVPTLVANGQVYQDSVAVIKYLIRNARGSVAIKLAARNEEELQVARKSWFDNIVNRHIKMEALAAQDNVAAKEYWAPRRDESTLPFRVYSGIASEEEKRAYFAWSQRHWARVIGFIADVLPTHLPETGFIDGAEPGINDFELGGWLTSVVGTTGGLDNVEKIAKKPLDEKVVKYFESWKSRQGWQIAYEAGLH